MAVNKGAIPLGKTCTLLNINNTTGAGTQTVYASVESDSVLVSAFAEVVSGTLDIQVFTLTEDGKELAVITFPQLSAPTSELALKKAAVIMSRIKVVATYTGNCTFEVRGRGISSGETSVKILGATAAKASQQTIGTTATLLIPSSLADRGGMVVKNNETTGTMYLGFTAAEATLATGYPIGPKESLGLDVSSGVAVYVRAAAGTIDVRLLEGGG